MSILKMLNTLIDFCGLQLPTTTYTSILENWLKKKKKKSTFELGTCLKNQLITVVCRVSALFLQSN